MPSTPTHVIVLTGATRGLGWALTQQFVKLGHTVVGCGRSPNLVADLASKYPTPHQFSAVDVSNAEQVQTWAEAMLAKHGPPTLLLNNAAVINPNAPLWEVPQEEFDRLIDVNVKGVANVLRSYLPAMVARQRGVVVNFSSGWGRSTSPQVAPYCASKYAVEGLTLALAQELPQGMAALPLNPGVIDTDMLRSTFGASAGQYPSAEAWARRAAAFLLQLGPRDNGKSLSIS
jgi:NAD(P)-dependent dehydrogenase (short-subunit alcohol dehydrogenase family)